MEHLRSAHFTAAIDTNKDTYTFESESLSGLLALMADTDYALFTDKDVELLEYVAPFCDLKEDYDAVMAFADRLRGTLSPHSSLRAGHT